MLDRIIQWSIRNRLAVIVLSVLLLVFGIHAAVESPLDVFPEFAPPEVVIRTEAPGFSPQDVESLVTLPLEVALDGMSSLVTLRSSSSVGLSNIICIFESGTDIFRARQLVTERLQTVSLTEGVEDPRMMPISASVGILLKLALTAETTSPMDLRTLADWTFRPRVLAVPGVSQVVVTGGEVKQYQVYADPLKLKDYGLTLGDVASAARDSNRNAGAGFLITPGQMIAIRGEGRVRTVKDIARTVVAVRDGVPVTVGQVAGVRIGPQLKIGDASLGATPCVYLTILKQPWANTLTVTEAVQEALNGLRVALPPDVRTTVVFRQADFIETAIHNIETAILEGGILVVAVLTLFLFSWRTGLISFIAIPLSLLTAILVLRALGATVNTMTLGGLAVAIGELVDDAVVDVENVFRRLRENRARERPEPTASVIYHASSEIRHSIIFATFIIALVFLPVLGLSGLAGRIFSPLAEAYILSILASLVVALTVTPALCMFLLPAAASRRTADSFTVRWVKRRYHRLLELSLDHPREIIGGAAVLAVAALVAAPLLEGEFLPEFNEGNLVIRMTALPGTALAQTMKLGRAAMARLREVPEVATVGMTAGRAELDEDALATNSGEIDVKLRSGRKNRAEVVSDVRETLASVPGVTFNVQQFISERIEEVLAGATGAIVIKLFGPDLRVLRQKADEIRALMASVPGIVDLQVEPQTVIPYLLVRFRREAMAQYGVDSGDLASFIQTAFRGSVLSRVFEEQRTFGLLVRSGRSGSPSGSGDDASVPLPWVTSIEQVRETLVDTPTGGKVPLSALADVEIAPGPNVINREDAERRIFVQANFAGQSLTATVRTLRDRLSRELRLPSGYYLVYGGQYQAQEAARREMLLLGGAALVGIALLLLLAFKNLAEALVVLASLPLALIGSIAAVAATGGVLSLGSLVGLVAVVGIVMRNGIMLITHYHHLATREGMFFGRDLVVRGAMERVSPVLMTALTAGLGLLPLAISSGRPGRELEQPMAVVILGGLFTATLLTLIVIPTLYSKVGRPTPAETGPLVGSSREKGLQR